MVPLESVGALVEANHANPFELLGPHEVVLDGQRAVSVRAYLPTAEQAWVIPAMPPTGTGIAEAGSRPMRRIHPAGLYEAILPSRGFHRSYQLRFAGECGQVITTHDPYAFEPYLTDFDRYLIGEGRHYNAYEKLGAQLRTVDGITGVNFAVWGPNAQSVALVGDFNGWDGRKHP